MPESSSHIQLSHIFMHSLSLKQGIVSARGPLYCVLLSQAGVRTLGGGGAGAAGAGAGAGGAAGGGAGGGCGRAGGCGRPCVLHSIIVVSKIRPSISSNNCLQVL